jgi:hypothetical protein
MSVRPDSGIAGTQSSHWYLRSAADLGSAAIEQQFIVQTLLEGSKPTNSAGSVLSKKSSFEVSKERGFKILIIKVLLLNIYSSSISFSGLQDCRNLLTKDHRWIN